VDSLVERVTDDVGAVLRDAYFGEHEDALVEDYR